MENNLRIKILFPVFYVLLNILLQFPDPDELPDDIRALCYFNAVRWVHDYQEACLDKFERFIRGERLFRAESSLCLRLNNAMSSSLVNFPSALMAAPPRPSSSGRSTPKQQQQVQAQQQTNLLRPQASDSSLNRRRRASMESGVRSQQQQQDLLLPRMREGRVPKF